MMSRACRLGPCMTSWVLCSEASVTCTLPATSAVPVYEIVVTEGEVAVRLPGTQEDSP